MSANVRNGHLNGHFLSDLWATGVDGKRDGFFDPFLKFVRANVQEHSSGQTAGTPMDTLKFGNFMIANGLSAKTVWSAIRQLASERIDDTRWRRPVILDRLQADLFRAIWRAERPALATFFLNSVAHFQHFHWRETEPELFTVKLSEKDSRTYADAIRSGYEEMDSVVGDMLVMAGPQTSIVMMTALSQKAMLQFEDLGGRQIFRHKGHAALMKWAGVIVPTVTSRSCRNSS